jgi:hypothetical protein
VAARAVADHLRADLFRSLGFVEGTGPGLTGASLSNLFAQRLLIPTAWFGPLARQAGYDLFELKRSFSTASHELLANRLLELDEPCIITVIDNGEIVRRRSNTGPVPRELVPAEEHCLQDVHEYSRPQVVSEDGWTVQGWPVHQLDFRREVLRSVCPEAGFAD